MINTSSNVIARDVLSPKLTPSHKTNIYLYKMAAATGTPIPSFKDATKSTLKRNHPHLAVLFEKPDKVLFGLIDRIFDPEGFARTLYLS